MASNPPSLTPKPGDENTAAAPPPKSFLFINKDPESQVLSRSSGRVATSINSHVQRWQDKKGGRGKAQAKPQAPQQTSTTKKATLTTYREGVTKFRQKPRQRTGPPASTREIPLEQRHSDSSSSGPRTAYSTTPESDGAVEIGRRIYRRPFQPTIHTANFSGADCIDPFQSTYAHYPGVQPILQYYVSFTLVSTFQSDSKAKAVRKEPPHFPAIRSIVQGSLQKQMHMYALLAATAARMKRVSGISFPRESSPEFLLHNAIRCIREYFSSCTGPLPVDDRQVILDIFYLCVCEWYEKSYEVARTHLAFVRHFWSSLTPSNSIFDRYIHDMITYNDVFLAIETASPPLFELTWEPAPLSEERIHEIEEETRKLSVSPSQSPSSASTSSRSPFSASTSLPLSIRPDERSLIATGFKSLTSSSGAQLPLELTTILTDLIPLIQTAHHHTHALSPPPLKEPQWVSLKTQALLHKLLSLRVQHHPLAESIRLALLVVLSCMSTSAAWRSGKVDMAMQASRLQTSVSLPPWQDARYPIVVDNIHYPGSNSPTLSPNLVGTDDKLLLWVLFTGAFAAQQSRETEQWFLTQAAQVARRTGTTDTVRLKAELLQYLYLDHLESRTLDRLRTAIEGVIRSPGS